jgi:hypothetical protein
MKYSDVSSSSSPVSPTSIASPISSPAIFPGKPSSSFSPSLGPSPVVVSKPHTESSVVSWNDDDAYDENADWADL